MDEGPLPCCFACIAGREKIAKIDYNKCLVYLMHTVFRKCTKHNVYLILAACSFHWAPWNSSEKIRNFSFPEFLSEWPVFKKMGKPNKYKLHGGKESEPKSEVTTKKAECHTLHY